MSTGSTIGKLIKYILISVVLLSPSLMVATKVFAADSGGYPWAHAELIDSATYDWGFKDCPVRMQKAGVCSVHTRYKWGVKYHLSDPWHYDLRNCTSYVAWRVNKEYGISIAGWGNAGNWDNAASGRFSVSNTPKVGDIAVWDGVYGHVAFVTKVYPNGYFEVDQYNNAGNGQFSHQLRKSAHHFIHVNPGKPKTPIKTSKRTAVSSVKKAEVSASKVSKLTKVTKPMPTSLEGSLVPRPGIGEVSSSSPLPSTRDIEYLIEYSPNTEELNAFAIRHTDTKSGKIEINQSNLSDRNTKFLKTKSSSVDAQADGKTKFALADYNSDKILDLYIIRPGGANSIKTRIVVLSGVSDYTSSLLETDIDQVINKSSSANYKVADINNDKKLDLYKITDPTENQNPKFEVLDGAKKYQTVISSWATNRKIPVDSSMNFHVGDHDGDGRADVYQTYQAPKGKGRFNIDIYEAKRSLKVVSRQIIVGNPTVKPDIVLPILKIKEQT